MAYPGCQPISEVAIVCRPKSPSSALRNSRGQAFVEFSFAFIFCLAFFFIAYETTRLMYNWVVLQYTANVTAREMRVETNAVVIQDRFIEIAQILGLEVDPSEVLITMTARLLTVEVDRDIELLPLTGLLLQAGGDHSGTYPIELREVVSRRVTNLGT